MYGPPLPHLAQSGGKGCCWITSSNQKRPDRRPAWDIFGLFSGLLGKQRNKIPSAVYGTPIQPSYSPPLVTEKPQDLPTYAGRPSYNAPTTSTWLNSVTSIPSADLPAIGYHHSAPQAQENTKPALTFQQASSSVNEIQNSYGFPLGTPLRNPESNALWNSDKTTDGSLGDGWKPMSVADVMNIYTPRDPRVNSDYSQDAKSAMDFASEDSIGKNMARQLKMLIDDGKEYKKKMETKKIKQDNIELLRLQKEQHMVRKLSKMKMNQQIHNEMISNGIYSEYPDYMENDTNYVEEFNYNDEMVKKSLKQQKIMHEMLNTKIDGNKTPETTNEDGENNNPITTIRFPIESILIKKNSSVRSSSTNKFKVSTTSTLDQSIHEATVIPLNKLGAFLGYSLNETSESSDNEVGHEELFEDLIGLPGFTNKTDQESEGTKRHEKILEEKLEDQSRIKKDLVIYYPVNGKPFISFLPKLIDNNDRRKL